MSENPMQSAVREFHEKFGLTIGDTPAVRDAELRANLIIEEAIEAAAALMCIAYAADRQTAYWKLRAAVVNAVGHACEKLPNDSDALLVEAIDGLCDSNYVNFGTAVVLGVDLQPFYDEVHRSNMAKEGGPMRADGKVLKPEGWQPPRIAEILHAQIINREASREISRADCNSQLLPLLRIARQIDPRHR